MSTTTSLKEKAKALSFSTVEGCRRLLAIFTALILVSSYFAYMLACDWGKIKVNDIAFDSRGAVMQATLYTPRIVHAGDNLPAILVTHGTSCSNSTVNGVAEELASRGFVVLSLSAYGSGSSETQDVGDPRMDPSLGIYDGLQYLRTLQYIDKTRIGMVGHSQGSKNVAAAVDMDCSLYTLNDLMLNVLSETFGQSFTLEEISQDADELAARRLSADQLVHYQAIRAEKEAELANTVYAAMILGGNWGFEEKEVSVAGHTVKRTPVCNAAWQIGLFNEGRAGTGQSNLVSESMMERFQTTSPVLPEIWYNTKTYNDGQRPASEQLGDIRNISSCSDAALQSALAQRTTHIIFTPNNTHARDYFGRDAVQHIVKYFEQVLCYNRGDLTDPATVPLDSSRLEFLMGKHLNLVALLSMCFGMLALSGILMRHKFFAVCKKEVCEPIASKKSVVFWVLGACYAAATYLTVAFVTKNGPALGFKTEWVKKFWSMDFTANIHIIFMWILAACGLVLVSIYCVYNYKKHGRNVLKELNFLTNFSHIAKYFLMAAILFFSAYGMLTVIRFFFHQDFRFWDNGVKDMLPQNFLQCLRYSIMILPTFLVGGLFVNAGRMKDMKDGPNVLVQMAISSAGLLAAYAVSYLAAYITYAQTGAAGLPCFAFVSLWPMFINLPLFVLLARFFYKQTGSVWLGAFVNTAIVCWSICSAQSSTGYYLLGSFGAKWLGIF